jgi:hypothetical protein
LLGAASELLILLAVGLVFDRIQENRIVPGHLFATDVVEVHRIGLALKEKRGSNDQDAEQEQQEQGFHQSFSSSNGREAGSVSITQW